MKPSQATFFLRLGSTVALWVLMLLAVFAGSEVGFFLVIAGMALLGLNEYFLMLERAGIPCFRLTGMLVAAVFLVGNFLYLRASGTMVAHEFEPMVLACFLIVVFARQMFESARERQPLQTMAYTFFGLLYIPWMFSFLTKLIFLMPRAADGATTGQYYVLYLVAVTKFSDMGAYLFGSLFGKHPFAPHISPKKTWEGFAGAMLLSLVASYGMIALLPGRLGALHNSDAAILGLLLGFSAVVGDLAESIVKRSTQIKDSGHVLPGIGGTLDLIDSVLFTAPLLYFYLRLKLGVG